MNSPLKLSLILGFALAAMNLTAIAGPGAGLVYKPLNSVEEISALAPGTKVAHQCPHCGAIAMSEVGTDKADAKGHTCPVCKMEVTYRPIAVGKAPDAGKIACVDTKTGKEMSAVVCAAH